MDLLNWKDFIERYGVREFTPKAHHFTGPLHVQHSPGCSGGVLADDGIALAHFAARFGGPVLEIGGDVGVSTRYICEGLERHTAQEHSTVDVVFSIDNDHKWEQDAYWPRRFRVNADSSKLIPADLPSPYGVHFSRFLWAFIDGCHSREMVLNDALFAYTVGCDAMVFHDGARGTNPVYRAEDNSGTDVPEAVPEFFAKRPDFTLIFVPTTVGLILAVRNGFPR